MANEPIKSPPKPTGPGPVPAPKPGEHPKPDEKKPKSSDEKKPEPGTKENPKPGQVLSKEQLQEGDEPKDEKGPTTDSQGNPLEPGSLVQLAARVTKAEDGKIDVEFVDPDPDPEAKKITATGIKSTTTKGTDINPRIGANPQKRGPGIREVQAKEGGIKPVAKTQEDDKSVQDLPVLTAAKSSTLTPVEEKKTETKKAA
jgi:hypothetical protein